MRISIVIPTWCEAACIADAVRTCAVVGDETIVADADSPDGTFDIARRAGARCVLAPRGRGPQLNAGAAVATGDVLWFVHADAVLHPQSRPAVMAELGDARSVGGNFRLRFVPETHAARVYSAGNHLRRRVLGIYYGDSCIFVRREVFQELGGYRDMPLFEDHEFAQRLERHGRTVYIEEPAVLVSARRFADRPVRTLALWTFLQTAYSLGVSAERLNRYYRAIR